MRCSGTSLERTPQRSADPKGPARIMYGQQRRPWIMAALSRQPQPAANRQHPLEQNPPPWSESPPRPGAGGGKGAPSNRGPHVGNAAADLIPALLMGATQRPEQRRSFPDGSSVATGCPGHRITTGAFEERMDLHHAASRIVADSGMAPAASQYRPWALASMKASQRPDFRAQHR